MPFRARLAFEVEAGHSISALDSPVEVVDQYTRDTWRLKQITAEGNMRGQRLDLRSPLCASREAAEGLGERAKAALLLLAVKRGFAFTFRQQVPTGTLTEFGKSYYTDGKYDLVLEDRTGVTVFEEVGRVGFVGMAPLRLLTGTPAHRVLQEWSELLPTCRPLSEPISTAFDLWGNSRSERSSVARFLMLIFAVEALAAPIARPQPTLAIVEQLRAVVRDAAIEQGDRARLGEAVARLRFESVGYACRALIASTLGDERVAEFSRAYRIRSEVAHGKGAPDAEVVVALANSLEVLVKDLLITAVGRHAA